MSKEERDLTEEELEQAVGGYRRRRARGDPKEVEHEMYPPPKFPQVTGVEPLDDPPFPARK